MRHAMIDIETLGTSPRAAVFQIGIMAFNPLDRTVPTLTKMWDVDVLSSIFAGGEVDPQTCRWWQKQAAAPEACGPGRKQFHIARAIKELGEFYTEQGCTGVWANSPSFDCVILGEAAKSVRQELPWRYRDQWDVRTFRGIAKVFDFKHDRAPAGHYVIQDCVDQVREVWELFADLGSDFINNPAE